jgi:hypothetical protein
LDTLPQTSLGRRERKKLRTRALIQQEAQGLLLEKGFEATTIEEIAEAAARLTKECRGCSSILRWAPLPTLITLLKAAN